MENVEGNALFFFLLFCPLPKTSSSQEEVFLQWWKQGKHPQLQEKTSLTRRTENRYLYDAESITVSTRNGLSYRKCMNSTGGQNPGFLVSVPKKEALGNHKVWEKSWRRGKWRDTLNLCMTL